MLRDLNGWVGDRLREGMNGGFEVPEENDNGRRVIDFCAGRGISASNTYFEHKSLYKYIQAARGQHGVEVKSIIDLALVKKAMLHYVQDVRVVRGRGRVSQNIMLYYVKLG